MNPQTSISKFYVKCESSLSSFSVVFVCLVCVCVLWLSQDSRCDCMMCACHKRSVLLHGGRGYMDVAVAVKGKDENNDNYVCA